MTLSAALSVTLNAALSVTLNGALSVTLNTALGVTALSVTGNFPLIKHAKHKENNGHRLRGTLKGTRKGFIM